MFDKFVRPCIQAFERMALFACSLERTYLKNQPQAHPKTLNLFFVFFSQAEGGDFSGKKKT